MDWIGAVVPWVPLASIVLSVAAFVISIAAHRQRTKQYARPALVDVSEEGDGYRWRVAIKNHGNADAKDVRLLLYSYPRRSRVQVASEDVLSVDKTFGYAFNVTEASPRDFRLTLTWRQGPDFQRLQRTTIRIPRVSLKDRLWRLVVRKTPYESPYKIDHDIGIY